MALGRLSYNAAGPHSFEEIYCLLDLKISYLSVLSGIRLGLLSLIDDVEHVSSSKSLSES